MGKRNRYIALIFLSIIMLGACSDTETEKLRQWRVSLEKEDKKPYGSFLAHESLHDYFPKAAIQDLSPQYRFTSINDNMNYASGEKRNLMIVLGLTFYVSDNEWVKLKEFAGNGNELVIFCSSLDNKIQTELSLEKRMALEERPYNGKDSSNLNVLRIGDTNSIAYGYRGRSLQGYFSMFEVEDSTLSANTKEDTTYQTEEKYYYGPDTIGYADGNPNIIRYTVGNGHITLHAAPLAMSNYFLLQQNNINYLTTFWQTIPGDIEHIYWINYLARSSEESSFSILWRYPATRWALSLSFLVLGLYVLFQMKRRQRIIPIIPPVKNDSVSFVETVGRLYFNKGNHRNLSEKMVQQFLEWVRMHYYLNTNLLNDEFIKQLTMKSGEKEAIVYGLIVMVQEVKAGTAIIDDAYLYQLHRTIQQFYKNNG